MNLYSGLVGEARSLSEQYRGVLDRLPRSFSASNLVELGRWPNLFEPEKAYFRALLKQLAELSESEFNAMFDSLRSFEAKTGCTRINGNNAEELQAAILNHLRRQGQYTRWRNEIDKIFQKLEPMVEARLYPADRDNRLVVILYGEGIAIERDKLWKRFREIGTRIQLDLKGAESSGPFLEALFTVVKQDNAPVGADLRAAPTIFGMFRESRKASPLDTWIIEAGDTLHSLCEKSTPEDRRADCATGLSYDRLRAYRERLTETIYTKVRAGIAGPLELAAYLKTLQMRPHEGLTLFADDLVMAFVRDVFLAGAGTLVINNTFVEWAAVQALKRAQPHLLVARFGVRDKMKPFSSLLLFSKPRPTDQIPIMQDPLGSFVDAELLAYYIWLNAEKGPPYRDRTLYLLLAEGVDEMLAVRSGAKGSLSGSLPTATLPDVTATMGRWLRIDLPETPGRALAPLLS